MNNLQNSSGCGGGCGGDGGCGGSTDCACCPKCDFDYANSTPGIIVSGDGSPDNPYTAQCAPPHVFTGNGITYTGTGEPGDPITVVCPDCPPAVLNLLLSTPGVTYTGNGTAGNPFVVTCPECPDCPPITFNPLNDPSIVVTGDGTAAAPLTIVCSPCTLADIDVDLNSSTPGIIFTGSGAPGDPVVVTCPAPPVCNLAALDFDDNSSTPGVVITGTGLPGSPIVVTCPVPGIDITGVPNGSYTGTGAPGDPFVVIGNCPPCEIDVTGTPGMTYTGTGAPGDPFVPVCPPLTPEIVEGPHTGCCTAGQATWTGTGLPGDPFVVSCNGPGADAVDTDNGNTPPGPFAGDVSSNDTPCTLGTTTYNVVIGSEVNGSVLAFNSSTGAYTWQVAGPGDWRFQYEILCDGVVVDTAWEFGCLCGDAVDFDNGQNAGPVNGDMSSNDTPCAGSTPTWVPIAGSEINGAITASSPVTGAFTFVPSGPGAWAFQYQLLCDGVVIDTAWEFGETVCTDATELGEPVLPDSDVGVWEIPFITPPSVDYLLEFKDESGAVIESAVVPAAGGSTGTYGTSTATSITFDKKAWAIAAGTYLHEHDVHNSGDPVAAGVPEDVTVCVTPVGCETVPPAILCRTSDFSFDNSGADPAAIHAFAAGLVVPAVGGMRFFYDAVFASGTQNGGNFNLGGPHTAGATFGSLVKDGSDIGQGCAEYALVGSLTAVPPGGPAGTAPGAPVATSILYGNPWGGGGDLAASAGANLYQQIQAGTDTTLTFQGNADPASCALSIFGWVIYKRNADTTCDSHISIAGDMVIQIADGSFAIVVVRTLNAY